MAEQKPSVGRVVHLLQGNDCLAATITAVDGEQVSLFVMPPGSAIGVSAVGVTYADPEQRREWNTWHWPERV